MFTQLSLHLMWGKGNWMRLHLMRGNGMGGNQMGGNGVGGALVRVSGAGRTPWARTDAEGRFTLESVATGARVGVFDPARQDDALLVTWRVRGDETRLVVPTHPDAADEGQTWLDNLNPGSLELLTDCRLEPSLAQAQPGERFQFERNGYFHADPVDSQPGAPVFNRTVTLRDTWAKIKKAMQEKA